MRAVFALALTTVTAMAQNVTGTIVGTVIDSAGGAVPSARVIVTNDQTGQRRELMTDQQGGYVANFLPVGLWERGGRKGRVPPGDD